MYILKDFITIQYSKEQIKMFKDERIKEQKHIANEVLTGLKSSFDSQADDRQQLIKRR